MAQIKPLRAELQKVAIEELGEVPARIAEDLQALKTWIQQQPHLRARTDDQFLIQFLRGCKFSLERAKEKIDHFYTLKTKYPDIFAITDVDNAKFREIHNLGCTIPLPKPLNGCGPRIVVFRFNHAVNKYSIESVLQVFNAELEVFLTSDPYACIYGVVYILDMGTASANHFLQFTPSILKKFFTFFEKTLPIRIKTMCYINISSAAEQFFKMLLPCLSDKLRERVVICGKKMSQLTECLPLEYLPQDYGGANGCLDDLCADHNKVWDEYRGYFQENAEYGTDERLRPGKPMDFDGVFGMGGSFRKIDVD